MKDRPNHLEGIEIKLEYISKEIDTIKRQIENLVDRLASKEYVTTVIAPLQSEIDALKDGAIWANRTVIGVAISTIVSVVMAFISINQN